MNKQKKPKSREARVTQSFTYIVQTDPHQPLNCVQYKRKTGEEVRVVDDKDQGEGVDVGRCACSAGERDGWRAGGVAPRVHEAAGVDELGPVRIPGFWRESLSIQTGSCGTWGERRDGMREKQHKRGDEEARLMQHGWTMTTYGA